MTSTVYIVIRRFDEDDASIEKVFDSKFKANDYKKSDKPGSFGKLEIETWEVN